MNHNNGEETVQKIITVAGRLFVEKGYEQTSVQDIINELGMSKGAIYHHFKSKQDILNRVLEEQFKINANYLIQFVNESEKLKYKDKLKEAMEKIASDSISRSLDHAVQSQVKNPHFIVDGLKRTVNDAAPIIANFIKKGIKDGSFQTEYPDEASEVLMLLLNIWINPSLFKRNKEETMTRLRFLQDLTRKIGVDVINDEMLDHINDLYNQSGSYIDNK